MFEELLHFLTLSQVHNRPQVNPTMSSIPLNNNNNNKLINEAGSLCRSNSVEEEYKIEEQSGQPISPASNSTVTVRETENGSFWE